MEKRISSRTGWSRSAPDYDGTGTGPSQQLGQKGHAVAVVSSCLSITLDYQAFHGPGDHRLLGCVKCTRVLWTDMRNRSSDSQTSFILRMATDTSNTNSKG